MNKHILLLLLAIAGIVALVLGMKWCSSPLPVIHNKKLDTSAIADSTTPTAIDSVKADVDSLLSINFSFSIENGSAFAYFSHSASEGERALVYRVERYRKEGKLPKHLNDKIEKKFGKGLLIAGIAGTLTKKPEISFDPATNKPAIDPPIEADVEELLKVDNGGRTCFTYFQIIASKEERELACKLEKYRKEGKLS